MSRFRSSDCVVFALRIARYLQRCGHQVHLYLHNDVHGSLAFSENAVDNAAKNGAYVLADSAARQAFRLFHGQHFIGRSFKRQKWERHGTTIRMIPPGNAFTAVSEHDLIRRTNRVHFASSAMVILFRLVSFFSGHCILLM